MYITISALMDQVTPLNGLPQDMNECKRSAVSAMHSGFERRLISAIIMEEHKH